MYDSWAINLVASSALTGSFLWHCWGISCFCRRSRERPFEKCANSFCTSLKAFFTLLTFSSLKMFIFLGLAVTGFAVFLTLKFLGWIYGIHFWTSALLVCFWPLFSIPLCSCLSSRWHHLHPLYLFMYLFSFLGRGGPHPHHMEVPRLEIESELQPPAYAIATAVWDPSHTFDLHHSSQQCQIFNPLSEAKDWTCKLMVTSQIRFRCATMGTPCYIYF